MSPASLSESASTPAALAAFLRGVERRGAVFADLQCGDATCAEPALAAAMRAFRDGAAASPVSDWPRQFWALLLAAPALRRAAPGANWPEALSALAGLGSGSRAALLLRLVAGLQDADAAAVLGIPPGLYRRALLHAAPRRRDGTADENAWHALADATRLAIRQLPATRLARLAQLREAALQHRRPPIATGRRRATAGSRPRWLLPALWTGVAACALVFSASFFVPTTALRGDDGEPTIRREPLPATEPASRFDAATSVLTDRDFEMLLAAGDADAIGDVGFQSWYAAQLASAEPDAATAPIAASDSSDDASMTNAAPATAALESDDAPR